MASPKKRFRSWKTVNHAPWSRQSRVFQRWREITSRLVLFWILNAEFWIEMLVNNSILGFFGQFRSSSCDFLALVPRFVEMTSLLLYKRLVISTQPLFSAVTRDCSLPGWVFTKNRMLFVSGSFPDKYQNISKNPKLTFLPSPPDFLKNRQNRHRS